MADAINFARRLSSRNEPDMLQEDFAGSSPGYSETYCFNLVKNVCPSSPLPNECRKYKDVTMALKRRDSSKQDQNIAFAGMSPGEKAAAMAARERGTISQAQVKRRLTSPTAAERHNSWFS